MNTAAATSQRSEFNDLAGPGEFLSPLFLKGALKRDFGYEPGLVEEIRQHLSAFQANVTSAAGFRMRAYLRAIKSGAIAAVAGGHTTGSNEDEEQEKDRVAFTFYMVTKRAQEMAAALSAAAMVDTVKWFGEHKEILKSLIDGFTDRYNELSEQVAQSQKYIDQAQQKVAATKQAVDEAGERLEDSEAQMKEAEERMRQSRDKVGAMREGTVIATYPENSVVPAVIYWKTGLTDEDGQALYMRAGFNAKEDRFDIIDSVVSAALIKKEIAGSKTKRIYRVSDDKGDALFVTVDEEQGIAGIEQVGEEVAAAMRMIMAKTGKTAEEITVSGESYAEEHDEMKAYEGDHENACDAYGVCSIDHKKAKSRWKYAVQEHESEVAKGRELHEDLQQCGVMRDILKEIENAAQEKEDQAYEQIAARFSSHSMGQSAFGGASDLARAQEALGSAPMELINEAINAQLEVRSLQALGLDDKAIVEAVVGSRCGGPLNNRTRTQDYIPH